MGCKLKALSKSLSSKHNYMCEPACIACIILAREFLELVDKHFPPGHLLHSLCNRSTLKVSYRCLPNMGSIVAKHNSKTMRKAADIQLKPKARCNCQKKDECPVPGECNQDGATYQATVTSTGILCGLCQKI